MKEKAASLVQAAEKADPTGSIAGFLRTIEWNVAAEPVTQQKPQSWLRLQTEAWERVRGLIGGSDASGAYDDDTDADGDATGSSADNEDEVPDQAFQILQLIRTIYDISMQQGDNSVGGGGGGGEDGGGDGDAALTAGRGPRFAVTPAAFVSHKLNSKLRQQLRDPLLLASDALPSWCEELTTSCPVLFPLETRQLFFACTAFGVSRTIAWLQKDRDAGTSATAAGRLEFQVGRLTSERVFVPRGEQLLDWAFNVFRVHAARKSVLDVEFQGEQGTGLGPTLEFYNLVAQDMQRKDLCMWTCSDSLLPTGSSLEEEGAEGTGSVKSHPGGRGPVARQDSNDDSRPPDFYVVHQHGLFPAALPRRAESFHDVLERFHFLGTFLAKSLQDSRLIALPLSLSMFKVLCGHALSLQDLLEILPEKASFLIELQDLVARKSAIDASVGLAEPEERARRYAELMLGGSKKKAAGAAMASGDTEADGGGKANAAAAAAAEEINGEHDTRYRLEDLDLSFVYQPTSHVYGYPVVTVDGFSERLHELRPGGALEQVTMENAEEYIQLTVEFVLGSGIAAQLESLRAGFREVFPIEKLAVFTPHELQRIMCGEQGVAWDMASLKKYTEPKHGYTRESVGFLQFLEVLDEFDDRERKRFLNFATGCPSLPPGGLANLYPRLTVVRKTVEDDGGNSGNNDATYPSVNTCHHYVKLPEYSSKEVLRERLLVATTTQGFFLT